jgi:hypothetical protein
LFAAARSARYHAMPATPSTIAAGPPSMIARLPCQAPTVNAASDPKAIAYAADALLRYERNSRSWPLSAFTASS